MPSNTFSRKRVFEDQEAKPAHDPTLETIPTSEAVDCRNLALHWSEEGVYKTALVWINRAVDADRTDPLSLRYKVYILYQLKGKNRYQEALKELEKAIELAPDDSWFWESYVEILCLLDRHQKALAFIDTIPKFPGSPGFSWSLRGHVLLCLDNDVDALLAFEKALELDESNERARSGKKDALNALRNLEKSIKQKTRKPHGIDTTQKRRMPGNRKTRSSTTNAAKNTVVHPGKIIKEELIDARGIKQNFVAEKIGLSDRHFYNVLQGRRYLSDAAAIKLADEFQFYTAEEIMCWQASYKVSKTRAKMKANPKEYKLS